MTFHIALPEGSRSATLDLLEPNSSAVQRFLRREGLAGYEPATVAALLSVFECSGPDLVFVDVGANIGLYSLLCSAIFDPERVVALEPSPDLARLARRIRDKNGLGFDVREIAASKTDGSAELHLADESDVSNSLESGFKISHRSVEVPTITIDRLVADWPAAPSVLKVDVEGHESAVLSGAHDLLERHRPTLVVEVLNRRRGRLAETISETLDGLSFSCYELSPTPTWERFDHVVARPEHRDWLVSPEPIEDEFIESWSRWSTRVARCTSDRNSRVPVVRTALAAFRRGGPLEVGAAARRFLRG